MTDKCVNCNKRTEEDSILCNSCYDRTMNNSKIVSLYWKENKDMNNWEQFKKEHNWIEEKKTWLSRK